MNVTPKNINLYIEELKKRDSFKQYSFHELDKNIRELEIAGLVLLNGSTSTIQFMKFQPLFSYFLNDLYKKLDLLKYRDLNKAFVDYYEIIGESISNQLNSKNPKLIRLNLLIVEKEIENLRKTIYLLLHEKQSAIFNLELIYSYFLKRNQLKKCADFFFDIQNKIEEYLDKTNIIHLMNYILVKNILGQVHIEMEFPHEAKIIYQQILNILEECCDSIENDRCQLLNAVTSQNLGVANKIIGDYDEAEKYYLESLAIYKMHNNIERQAEINQNLGNVKRLQEKFNEAKKYINDSLELFFLIKDEKKIAENHHNLALLESHLKNYKQAETTFLIVIKAYEKFNENKSKAEAYQDLGNCYLTQKKLKLAKKYFNFALDLFINNDFQQGQIFLGLGVIEQKKGNDEKANLYYLKALDIALKYKDYREIAKLLNNLHKVKIGEDNDLIIKKAWEKIERQFNKEEIEKIITCAEQLIESKNDILDF